MKSKIVLLGLVSFFMVGCANNSQLLTKAGQSVEIVDELPSTECQFLGVVEGKRDTFFTGVMPYSELAREATFDLLNNAAKMGSNVVYHLVDTGNGILSSLAPLPIVMKAEAYRCMIDD